MKILATFDGSPLSESIIPLLNKLAMIPHSEAVLVRVDQMPLGRLQREGDPAPVAVGAAAVTGTPLVVQSPPTPVAENREQAVERRRDELDTYLHGVGERLNPVLKWHAVAVFDDNPSAAIVKLAIGEQPDVIVMATHGHTGLAHILFGDVAEAVVKSGVAPVLLVHPDAITRHRNGQAPAGHESSHTG
jgi:nucleotide-binding universal stress UspA family protein